MAHGRCPGRIEREWVIRFQRGYEGVGDAGFRRARQAEVRAGVLRASIFGAWVLSTAWLIRYEAFPRHFTKTLPGYRALVGDELVRESWMRIRIGDQPVGYSFTLVETSGDRPDEFVRIRNELHLRVQLLGRPHDLRADLEVALDAWNLLQSFSFTLHAGVDTLRVRGRRSDADRFDVRLTSDRQTQRMTLRIPDDAVLYSPMAELAVQQLRPGQTYTLRTLDPSTLRVVPLALRALRRETIEVAGLPRETTVISASAMGLQTLSWIDAEGAALRTETPFGWVLEACTIEEAFEALRRARDGAPAPLPAGLPETML